jgi:hypothetical protein
LALNHDELLQEINKTAEKFAGSNKTNQFNAQGSEHLATKVNCGTCPAVLS